MELRGSAIANPSRRLDAGFLARLLRPATARVSRCRGVSSAALAELRRLPPLVTSWEIVLLRQQLAEAADGERFVLQGGDCAERFDDCTSPRIANMLKVLLADEPGAGGGARSGR